jgi:hypothetical protein
VVVEWCDCPDELTSGHVSLAPVVEVWVHGVCLRPSFAWWKAHEQFCFECGRSFSSPMTADGVCRRCDPTSETWAGLAALWKNIWRQIYGNRLTSDPRSGSMVIDGAKCAPREHRL